MAMNTEQTKLEELLARQESEAAETRAKLEAILNLPDNVKLAQELHAFHCPLTMNEEYDRTCNLDVKWVNDAEAEGYQEKADKLLEVIDFATALRVIPIVF